jgi:hypothetical protein
LVLRLTCHYRGVAPGGYESKYILWAVHCGNPATTNLIPSSVPGPDSRLRRAGGEHRLDCDALITLTNTLVVSKDLVLDASDHVITLSARHNNRLIEVRPGAHLTLRHLNLIQGQSSTLTQGSARRASLGCILSGPLGPGRGGRPTQVHGEVPRPKGTRIGAMNPLEFTLQSVCENSWNPGGIAAISRWLSEARATPPVHRPIPSTPEGSQVVLIWFLVVPTGIQYFSGTNFRPFNGASSS